MNITKDLRKEIINKAYKMQYCKLRKMIIDFVLENENIEEDELFEMYKKSQQNASDVETTFNIRLYRSVLKLLETHKKINNI